MTYRHYFLSDRRRGALLLRRNKRAFKHIVTGNKSGALLLTIFVLTLGATNEWFTKRRAESAVQEGDGQIDEAKASCVQSDAGVSVLAAWNAPRRRLGLVESVAAALVRSADAVTKRPHDKRSACVAL